MYRKLLVIAPIFTLIVVVAGAYTRLTDSGLGCPDWPGCYGQWTAPDTAAEVARAEQRFPDAPIDSFKGWVEMIHRYLAGTLGLIILAIAASAWASRLRKPSNNADTVRDAHWLATGVLVLVAGQAMLGMFTVTLMLKPAIVTSHLLGGMLILAVLFRMAVGEFVDRGAVAIERAARLAPWAAGGVALVLGQIMLGGWVSTNYAALVCLDFPTCHGSLVPPMDFEHGFHVLRELGEAPDGSPLSHEAMTAIQWTHRVGALVITAYLGTLGVRALRVPGVRGAALGLLVLLAAQVGIGVLNVAWLLPLWLATLHNLGAALLLCAVVMLRFMVSRPARSASNARASYGAGGYGAAISDASAHASAGVTATGAASSTRVPRLPVEG
ncbi:MAG: COX15/CtaA family protein [Proteobacteria bacterium]|nr:COX15/CtaA family protein [Burkholderiales bacterium]